MDTFAPTRTYRHAALRLTTHRSTEFVDITDILGRVIDGTGVRLGTLNAQTTHTTTGIVVNEGEPLLLQDFERFLDRLAPRTEVYLHDDLTRRPGVSATEPLNGHAHCRALLLPASTLLNIVDGRLALGRWQRVFLVELDGPRERTLNVVVAGEPAL